MTDEIYGRRLECTVCGERLPQDERRFEHVRECDPYAMIDAPYRPDRYDREHTKQMKLTDL